MKDFKHFLPYALVLLVTYIVIPMLQNIDPDPETKYWLVLLVFFNPLVNLIGGVIYGLRRKAPFWWFPIASVVLFLPSMFLYYNSSALIYAGVYAVLSFAGAGMGYVLARARDRSGSE